MDGIDPSTAGPLYRVDAISGGGGREVEVSKGGAIGK